MKIATDTMITEFAKKFQKIGNIAVYGMYGVDENGEMIFAGARLYRDSLSNLKRAGVLQYNGDFTYSLAK